MAAKRKLTLADIQSAGDKRRIDPQGHVRPAYERIRPQRFQPERQLLDFRGLSKTINQAAKAVGQYQAAQEAEDDASKRLSKYYERSDETVEDLAAEDGPIRFLEGPEPVYHDDPHRDPVLGQPGISAEPPDTTPPHLRETKEEISDAGRVGVISPLRMPLLDRAVGKAQAEAAAYAIYETMRNDDLGEMTRGVFRNGEYVPNVDFKTRLRERVQQMWKLHPELDPRSSEADPAAIRIFAHYLPQYERDLSDRVWKDLEKNKLAQYKVEIVRGLHVRLDAGMDVSTTTYTDLSTLQLYTQGQKALGGRERPALEVINDQMVASASKWIADNRLGFKGDIVEVYAKGIVGKARQIEAKYHDNPDELESQLRQLLEVSRQVVVGPKGELAGDDPRFDAAEDLLDEMLRKAEATGVGDNRGAEWRRHITDMPIWGKVFDALEDKDALALAALEKEFRKSARSEAAKLNLGQGRKFDNFMRQARITWRNQATPFGHETTRAAISDFSVNAVARMAQQDVKVARDYMNQLFDAGAINIKGLEAAEAILGSVGASNTVLNNDARYKGFFNGMSTRRDKYGGLGISDRMTRPVLEEHRQAEADIRQEAASIFHQAKASGDDGLSAVRESMATGLLKALRDDADRPINEFNDTRQKLIEELLDRKSKGQRVAPGEVAKYREGIGVQSRTLIEDINKLTSEGVVFYSDKVTAPAGDALVKALDVAITEFVDGKYDPKLTIDPDKKARELAYMRAKMPPLFRKARIASNKKQFGKGSEAFRSELIERWKKDLDEIKKQMPEVYKQNNVSDKSALAMLEAERLLNETSHKGNTRDTMEKKSAASMTGTVSPLDPQLRGLIDGKAWGRHRSRAKYGTGGTAEWHNSLGVTLVKIGSIPAGGEKFRNQLRYEALQMSGKVFITDIEGAKDASFTVRMPIPDEDVGRPVGVSQKHGQAWDERFHFLTEPITFSVADLNLKHSLGAMFKSRADMEEFTSDGDRFAALSEKLGFGKWDPAKNPSLDPDVIRWKKIQGKLIDQHPKGYLQDNAPHGKPKPKPVLQKEMTADLTPEQSASISRRKAREEMRKEHKGKHADDDPNVRRRMRQGLIDLKKLKPKPKAKPKPKKAAEPPKKKIEDPADRDQFGRTRMEQVEEKLKQFERLERERQKKGKGK
jgi:hypothetical protein